jgi:hypothetical protein
MLFREEFFFPRMQRYFCRSNILEIIKKNKIEGIGRYVP